MDIEMTLAEIVDANPRATRAFERLQLDYCCGGQRSLVEACATLGLDPEDVLRELEGTDQAPAEWAGMAMAELTDHIESTHHRFLHEEFPRLGELMAKVLSVHGANHPELRDVAAAFGAVREDLEPHLMKEERVLFPMIRELSGAQSSPSFHCGSISNPIRMMMLEHDRAGELLAELRRVTDDFRPPADACGSYQALFQGLADLEADTHLHVHKENNVLFPSVLSAEAALAVYSRQS